MARLINADDALGRYYAEWEQQDICDGSEDRDWLKKCIDESPTIEAEPVVHCKYCIKWQMNSMHSIGWCNIVDGYTNPKNFCCWGEESPFRKKKDDN